MNGQTNGQTPQKQNALQLLRSWGHKKRKAVLSSTRPASDVFCFFSLIFNCLICDSRSLKCVLGYGLGDFSVVWGVLGCFSDLREDKSVAHLLNLAGNQMGQSMTDF